MKFIYKSIKYALLLLMLIIGISFASLNKAAVTIDFWVYSGHFPLALVVGIAILLGVLVSNIYFLFPLLKRKVQIRSLSKKLDEIKP